MYSWNNLMDFFSAINKIDYIVLRNFENYDDKMINQSHPDIDILCSNRDELVIKSRSISRTKNPNDKIHRKILVCNNEVDLDIRCIGDGYYDEKWEKAIINHRILWKNMFYVPNKEDYFYSLLYHALIQKKTMSKDYEQKLKQMAQDIGIESEKAISIQLLEKYMIENDFHYTYPEYSGAVFNLKQVDRRLIKKDYIRMIKRLMRKIRNII